MGVRSGGPGVIKQIGMVGFAHGAGAITVIASEAGTTMLPGTAILTTPTMVIGTAMITGTARVTGTATMAGASIVGRWLAAGSCNY